MTIWQQFASDTQAFMEGRMTKFDYAHRSGIAEEVGMMRVEQPRRSAWATRHWWADYDQRVSLSTTQVEE